MQTRPYHSNSNVLKRPSEQCLIKMHIERFCIMICKFEIAYFTFTPCSMCTLGTACSLSFLFFNRYISDQSEVHFHWLMFHSAFNVKKQVISQKRMSKMASLKRRKRGERDAVPFYIFFRVRESVQCFYLLHPRNLVFFT